MSLFKHTITIWSPHAEMELVDLAQRATDGDSYCSDVVVRGVEDPVSDKSFTDGAAEFFDLDKSEGVPYWTFYGHWENDRIVVESHEEGEHEDNREDTGYWEQGLWAAGAQAPTVEMAQAMALTEYEQEPGQWFAGYEVGAHDRDLPAGLDELSAEEQADFALGMLCGAWRSDPSCFGTWRQTACVFCEHDVEGQIGESEWRDRGGNTHCPPYQRYDRDLQQKMPYTPPATQKHIGRLP